MKFCALLPTAVALLLVKSSVAQSHWYESRSLDLARYGSTHPAIIDRASALVARSILAKLERRAPPTIAEGAGMKPLAAPVEGMAPEASKNKPAIVKEEPAPAANTIGQLPLARDTLTKDQRGALESWARPGQPRPDGTSSWVIDGATKSLRYQNQLAAIRLAHRHGVFEGKVPPLTLACTTKPPSFCYNMLSAW